MFDFCSSGWGWTNKQQHFTIKFFNKFSFIVQFGAFMTCRRSLWLKVFPLPASSKKRLMANRCKYLKLFWRKSTAPQTLVNGKNGTQRTAMELRLKNVSKTINVGFELNAAKELTSDFVKIRLSGCRGSLGRHSQQGLVPLRRFLSGFKSLFLSCQVHLWLSATGWQLFIISSHLLWPRRSVLSKSKFLFKASLNWALSNNCK